MRRIRVLAFCLMPLAAVAPAWAQESPETGASQVNAAQPSGATDAEPTGSTPDPGEVRGEPDIDLQVRLRADSVRLSADPDIHARATGTDKALVTESSLPELARVGRTYRNVHIDTRLRAWLEGEGVVVESEATLLPDADGRMPLAEPDAPPDDETDP